MITTDKLVSELECTAKRIAHLRFATLVDHLSFESTENPAFAALVRAEGEVRKAMKHLTSTCKELKLAEEEGSL
jgi:hypothetical protein